MKVVKQCLVHDWCFIGSNKHNIPHRKCMGQGENIYTAGNNTVGGEVARSG